jgi:hypothetical protein
MPKTANKPNANPTLMVIPESKKLRKDKNIEQEIGKKVVLALVRGIV